MNFKHACAGKLFSGNKNWLQITQNLLHKIFEKL